MIKDPELELVSLADIKKTLMKDPEFAAEYDALEERRKLVAMLKAARLELRLTQSDIAEKSGINVKNISRLERGIVSPTLTTLSRYAHALGGSLTFQLQQ
ncbi:helix-turn-helix domain-containing protein [Testudinibacter sp. TR-2022]|uniref:helix-turn-helix domain-containing protein n=1 Tax=Testudinibacter sp. TR-2022 TaxID=2585029 RepID=UPI002278C1EA|nr:helix-turn-helix transcriptional regulator [Testudinibacter sp. TR-2022]